MSLIINHLSSLITEHQDSILEWFHTAYKGRIPSFYSSVDLRHSGRKLVPVDTNLFPAGFNNLDEAGMARATVAASTFLTQYFPEASRLLLIPENHTRNLHYLDNVHTLKTILEQTGKEVVLGSVEAEEALTLTSHSGYELHVAPLHKQGDRLETKAGFNPDVVVINNDLTAGVPELLTDIAQPIIPSPQHGWHIRRKSAHFAAYDQVVRAFSEQFSFDPFLISTIFRQCGMVNFKERLGIECVALGVENVLHTLRQKYAEYGITDEPYVFIKADNGTYGMGIMTARSGEELYEMNKKLRNKMGTIKEGVVNTEVIIQEGIPTIDMVDGHVAEPMIYLMGGDPVGCIYRVNTEHDAFGNLNAHGMRFERQVCQTLPGTLSPFGLIAKLATLAASYEQY